ncbi:MAG TPA: methyltransferase domain-containing protein [Longimicrobiaceae bacterium]|nr:methyltransferase domain-containing protein [Longimicrobiaceae bacterium]
MRTPLLRAPALAAALLVLFAGTAGAQRKVSDVPYVPTSPEAVERILALAAPTPDDVVYDLGSGDGRIVIAAARDHGARGLGVEIEADLVRRAEENARAAGVADRVRFVRGDLFELDLRPATVVTLYLLSSLNLRLRPRLLEQLRPGSRVVSNSFSMGDWEPDSVEVVERAPGQFGPRIYYWVVPARVAGSWEVEAGGERFTLELTQRFQKLRGTVRSGGRAYPLEEAALRGDRVSFAWRVPGEGGAARRFTGRVSGDAMTGEPAGSGVAWRARRNPM